jgi:hypothetical protein
MSKFLLGLTSGLAIGSLGSLFLIIGGIVALEDSPKILEALSKDSDTK